jgi:hypothetical protein
MRTTLFHRTISLVVAAALTTTNVVRGSVVSGTSYGLPTYHVAPSTISLAAGVFGSEALALPGLAEQNSSHHAWLEHEFQNYQAAIEQTKRAAQVARRPWWKRPFFRMRKEFRAPWEDHFYYVGDQVFVHLHYASGLQSLGRFWVKTNIHHPVGETQLMVIQPRRNGSLLRNSSNTPVLLNREDLPAEDLAALDEAAGQYLQKRNRAIERAKTRELPGGLRVKGLGQYTLKFIQTDLGPMNILETYIEDVKPGNDPIHPRWMILQNDDLDRILTLTRERISPNLRPDPKRRDAAQAEPISFGMDFGIGQLFNKNSWRRLVNDSLSIMKLLSQRITRLTVHDLMYALPVGIGIGVMRYAFPSDSKAEITLQLMGIFLALIGLVAMCVNLVMFIFRTPKARPSSQPTIGPEIEEYAAEMAMLIIELRQATTEEKREMAYTKGHGIIDEVKEYPGLLNYLIRALDRLANSLKQNINAKAQGDADRLIAERSLLVAEKLIHEANKALSPAGPTVPPIIAEMRFDGKESNLWPRPAYLGQREPPDPNQKRAIRVEREGFEIPDGGTRPKAPQSEMLEESFQLVKAGVERFMPFVDIGENLLPGQQLDLSQEQLIVRPRAWQQWLEYRAGTRDAAWPGIRMERLRLYRAMARAISAAPSDPILFYPGLGASDHPCTRLDLLEPLVAADFTTLVGVELGFIRLDEFQKLITNQLRDLVDVGTEIISRTPIISRRLR